jgi:acetyl-CoA/propionyl-CoA carboxylase biotin carboxyl carrier protein
MQHTASLRFSGPGHAELTLGGAVHDYAVAPVQSAPGEDGPGRSHIYLGNGGWSCRLDVLTREARLERVLAAIQREEGAADPAVRSPMPGTVVAVPVRDGDAVEAGQVLVSIEAMKMEHQLVAPLAGTVHLSARQGDLVKADQVLATIHPHAATEPEHNISLQGKGAP